MCAARYCCFLGPWLTQAVCSTFACSMVDVRALQEQVQNWHVSHLLVQLDMQQWGRAQEVQHLPSSQGNTFGIAAAMPFCKQGRGQSKLPAAAEHK